MRTCLGVWLKTVVSLAAFELLARKGRGCCRGVTRSFSVATMTFGLVFDLPTP